MTTRLYSSISQETTLAAALSAGASTMTVVNASGLLATITPAAGETFVVVIDPDTALEEIVEVIAPSAPGSNTLTINRNIDASTAQSHSAGAAVRHMAIGRDFRDANQHIENTTTAHGLTLANVVKTTDTSVISSGMIITGAVGTTKIDDLSVTTAKINDAAITAVKIGTDAVTTAKIQDSAVTSAKIADGTIVNADISGTAAIAASKIAGTAVTAADTGTVTSAMIANDTIVNADINSSAQIAYSKTNLTNSIVDADVNASAAIAWTKIAPSSTVSSTELGYLDGVTSSIQTQLNSKLATSTASSTYAPLASPALTGVPTAPTAAANTNTTQIATTAYVQTEINDLIAAAPGALDTLDELAAALGDDANFATTVTNSLATKLNLSGGTMSGAIAMGTNKITGLGDPTSAQDAATKNYIDNVVLAPSNLTGPITSVGNVTSIASQTGTGTKFVVDTSPTLITPVLGVATATSINGTTIPTSKTLVATDSTQYVVPSQTGNSGKALVTNGTTSSWSTTINGTAIPATKTLVVTTDKLSVHAATTSAELAGVISDETGTGALVFGTSPTISGATLTNAIITQAILTPTFSANAYTLVLGDQGDILLASNGATAGTINIPTDASVAFPTGTQITVIQTGAGQLTIQATTPATTTVASIGATSTAPKLRVQNSSATLIKTNTNQWYVVGDIA